MNLKQFLIAGAASTLLLTACSQSDDAEKEEEAVVEESDEQAEEKSDATEVEVSADDLSEAVEFDGEYGKYVINRIDTITIPPTDEEKKIAEEEGEEATDTEVVVIEFDFTNLSDVPTAASEAFALDLAVRHFNDEGMVPTDNYTLDIPEDSTYHELINDSAELLQQDESIKSVVAYGPIDSEADVHVQSRQDESQLDLKLQF